MKLEEKYLFNLLNSNMMKSTLLIFSISVTLFYSCSRSTEEIRVTDFGAIPNDTKDDTPSILSAFESCKNKKNSKLVFEPGSYDIFGSKKDKRGNWDPAIIIRDISNMTIEGNGSEFIGHDYSSMFHFSNCSNLSINNLTIDWDPLPYTQGKVTGVDTNYIDIEVVAPFIAKEGLLTEAILGYDIEKHRMMRSYTDHYQLGFNKTTEVISPGVMRLYIGRKDRFAGTMPAIGTYVIARHQVYGYQSFEFEKCTKVHLENVNIYSNPGMGVTGDECRDINIRHLRVMLKPGSGRWMSCTADATHFAGCRGTIIMEDCLFEGMGDDATNVRSGHYLLVSGRLDNNRLRIKTGYRYGSDLTPPEIGDKLEIGSEDKPLLSYATVTVRSVEKDTLDRSLVIGFSEKLPENTGKGDVVGNASSIPVLRIRNCTTIRNRSRGFIIKTRDVIIEDCTFQDITECAVALESDVNAWWESISSRDVIIRNNRFIDSKFDPGYLHGVIESHTMSQTAPAGVYRRITIANNIFLGSVGNIIKIGSADDVNIINNIMDHPEEEAILLYNSRNIRITGNKLTNCKIGLKIGEGCDPATIMTENNIGF
jgi:parallel beta-helix repeat protein